MVSIGYHYEKGFIVHPRFKESLARKCFICNIFRTTPERVKKLKTRAHDWFNCDLKIEGTYTEPFIYDYSNTGAKVPALLYEKNPPTYLQLFHNRYNCIKCKRECAKLVCDKCIEAIVDWKSAPSGKKVVVFGGVNGFGKIIANTFKSYGNTVVATSRNPTGDNKKFVLGESLSNDLLECIDNADILVLNATKTLESDEKVWNTTLMSFNKDLLLDRINTNVLGYVKFMQDLCQHKLKNLGHLRQQTLIYVDANESKFEGKMVDGKHLELNIAKCGVKQIFYTFANVITKLGMSLVCYDPGWLSYHGISIEKKKSKSQLLILPIISAMGLMSGCSSVYEFINKN
jgi:NAD(P)-dependent dehydrogenase (short-subunit alcohol dehydrogenase family)